MVTATARLFGSADYLGSPSHDMTEVGVEPGHQLGPEIGVDCQAVQDGRQVFGDRAPFVASHLPSGPVQQLEANGVLPHWRGPTKATAG
jgi:hypothetical protein